MPRIGCVFGVYASCVGGHRHVHVSLVPPERGARCCKCPIAGPESESACRAELPSMRPRHSNYHLTLSMHSALPY
jgi:hypothetical protein